MHPSLSLALGPIAVVDQLPCASSAEGRRVEYISLVSGNAMFSGRCVPSRKKHKLPWETVAHVNLKCVAMWKPRGTE